MKALLLNPPGRRLYLRDYFCSKVSQADYVHPPIDLVVQSGWLAERFEVTLCDAIVAGLSRAATIERVRAEATDAIVALAGAASVDEDAEFLAELRTVHDGPIVATILGRRTQTNEVGRLATLVPAFALAARDAGEPLALVEVGPSAGLCLYPDRYRYRWRGAEGETVLGVGPDLPCRVDGPVPFPDRLPEVSWRAGVDLHPLSVHDQDAMDWLETLVWPEQEDRRVRLRAAIDIAAAEPPFLVRGNLLDELPALVAEAEAFGRVVVFHSAVIAYLEPADRRRFADLMRGLVAADACHWVSNEAPGVLPEVTSTGPSAPPGPTSFVLGLDGQAVAWTHGHGSSLTWL